MYNLRGIGLWVQNWHGKFNEFWPEHLKISKNCCLMGCLWLKYIIFELTNYRGVMFNDTEVWYRTWRRTNSCFPKMTWGIWQIITKPLESLKIATLMGSYDPKWKMYELKIYSGAMCHDKKKDVKSEEELTCQIKIDMRKLWLEHSKVSKVCILMGLLLTKVYNFWPKKVQRSYLSWHWRVMQNLKRNWHAAFKINIRNLANFDSSTQNSHKFAL